MRFTLDEYEEYLRRQRENLRRPQSALMAEAQRQARRAKVEDRPTETESKIQQRGVALAREAMQLAGYDPRMLFAVPNGADVSDANRMRLVAEGMTAGVPDLLLLVAKIACPYGAIEVKRPKGKLSDAQHSIRMLFEGEGCQYYVCFSAEQIRDAVIEYLGIGAA